MICEILFKRLLVVLKQLQSFISDIMIDSNYFESNLTNFFKSDDRRSQKRKK